MLIYIWGSLQYNGNTKWNCKMELFKSAQGTLGTMESLKFRGVTKPPVFSLFHWNGVLTRQANVQSKGPLIAKFARAMVEAIHIYKRDKESTLKIISKYTQITDPD